MSKKKTKQKPKKAALKKPLRKTPKKVKPSVKNKNRKTTKPISKIKRKTIKRKLTTKRPRKTSTNKRKQSTRRLYYGTRLKKTRTKLTQINQYSGLIYSTKDDDFKNITNFKMNLKRKDQLNLNDIENRDANKLQSILSDYLEQMIGKVKGETNFFLLKINYFDGEKMATISNGLSESEIMPEDFYAQLKELNVFLVARSEKYLTKTTDLILKSIVFQTYKDI